MILAGDIGGTKTVLALLEERAPAAGATTPALAILREEVYLCADYPSLEAILDVFMHPDDLRQLSAACFGVAGPIVDGTAKVTNLPWTIDAANLTAKLGVAVDLLNDLQATALGILVLPDTAFAVLQPAVPTPGGPIAVLAPGTGLGEALLVSAGSRYRALPSEGGHGDFAPGTEEEIELLRFLWRRYGDHVSYERVLTGSGIGNLYDFVRAITGSVEPAWLTEQLAGPDRNAAISRAALDRSDAACVRALDMFVEILGAEAGNLALRVLATGGVVIGGGIPPKLLPALQQPRFVERFNAKGRFAPWNRRILVRVALEPRAALFGAAHHAASHKDPRS